jgi:tetratricopeptide (TPR) repeat protein/DNA-binding winged helix-turn-helix (wHTH) protein
MRIGEWRVDPAVDEIARGDTIVKLEPRAMRLLCVLAERPGEVCSAEYLLDRVWPGVIVAQTSVYQTVAALRRALDDSGATSRCVATVPRKGYRLIAPVAPWDDAPPSPQPSSVPASAPTAPSPIDAHATPGGPARESTVPAPTPPAPRASRLRRALAVAAVVVLAAGAAGWWVGRAPAEQVALVVEPVADLSDDGSGRAFALGMRQELIGALGATRGFRVVASRDDSPGEATAAGARYVLGGAVRLHEGRARVTLQLVDARDNVQVWANSFDRARTQPVAAQAEVAQAAARAIERHFARRGDAPPELSAYDLYLLGRRQQLLRQAESIDRALHYYARALAADPEFALAQAGLAEAQLLTYWYQSAPFDGAVQTAETSIRRALELDPELAEGYAARGMLRIMQWRIDEAIADLQRAIAINPNLGEAYQRLGIAYDYAGRPRDALAAYDQLLAIDPLHTNGYMRRGLILNEMGRYDDAERALARAYELQPELPNPLWARALVRYAQGDLDGAVRYYRQAIARGPQRTDLHRELALLYLDLGDVEAARSSVEEAARHGRATDPEVASARAFFDAFTGGIGTLRGRAAEWRKLEQTSDVTRNVELAGLTLAAGDPAQAAALLPSGSDRALRNTYSLAWSLCEPCTVAAIAAARGPADAARRGAGQADEWLETLRASGYRFHGMEYGRALRAAAAGRRDEAIAALERAHAAGWRRAWMVPLEPAFAPVVADPRFRSLVERIRAESAEERAALEKG